MRVSRILATLVYAGVLSGLAACDRSDGINPNADDPVVGVTTPTAPPAAAPSSANPVPVVAAAGPSAAGAAAPEVAITPAMPGVPAAVPAPPGLTEVTPGLHTGPAAPPRDSTVPPGLTRIIPVDTREAKQAGSPPVPISGGTLLLSSDGRYAVAADPERDRVSIVDLWFLNVARTIALQPGDEPGRLVEDGARRVHVALRRAGAVASIDLATQRLIERRAVCSAPRGLAYEAATQQLLVACAGGELVSLPAGGGEVSARLHPTSDLRDVVVKSDGLYVSRLKPAELVRLDSNKAVVEAQRPELRRSLFAEASGSSIVDTLEPILARRTIASSAGGFLMLHQGSRNGEIQLKKPDDTASLFSNAYGGGAGSCTSVVATQLTRFDATGRLDVTAEVSGVLASDIAESPKDGEIAIAFAGGLDLSQPQVTFAGMNDPQAVEVGTLSEADVLSALPGVFFFHPAAFERTTLEQQRASGLGCLQPQRAIGFSGQATAIAFLTDGRLLIQSRQPPTLFIAEATENATGTLPTAIDLGGVSTFDTGHEIFHRDAGAGVACASCHFEGTEDGHTWIFSDQGPRRTQSLDVGLEGTAPFHWVGDMNDLATLMEQVFVGRMGGVHQSDARRAALERWLYAIKPPAPLRAADEASLRGQALFQGDAKCTSCHVGAKFTNNKTVDVGTGVSLQVPSLIGIGHRAPFMHNGCAATLYDRFNPACGGSLHGNTALLSGPQIDDLVAYLDTL